MNFLTILCVPHNTSPNMNTLIPLTPSYVCPIKCVLINRCEFDAAITSFHHDYRSLMKNKCNKTLLLKVPLIFLNFLEVSKRRQPRNYHLLFSMCKFLHLQASLKGKFLDPIPDLLHLNVHLMKSSGDSYAL